MADIIVLGAAGHASVVIDVVERADEHRIVGLLDPGHEIGETVHGYPILGGDEDLPGLAEERGVEGCLVAVGDNWHRHRIASAVEEKNPEIQFVSAVHPGAEIGRDVVIDAGTVVMAGAVVNTGSRIGRHCIVNTSASIDHDCVLEDWSSVAPGATLGGNVRVGAFSAVSLGARVIHEREIGEHTVVGAGAVVVEDLPDRAVAYGVPAREVRSREPGEPYL